MKAAPDPQNGRIVAEVNSDIGHFSLGNRMEGEHHLVVSVIFVLWNINI